MSTTTRTLLAALLLLPALALAQQPAAKSQAARTLGLGSAATESELKRFTSPLPDGRGLPPGAGSVAEGQAIYMQSCAACHGENLQGGMGDRLIGGGPDRLEGRRGEGVGGAGGQRGRRGPGSGQRREQGQRQTDREHPSRHARSFIVAAS